MAFTITNDQYNHDDHDPDHDTSQEPQQDDENQADDHGDHQTTREDKHIKWPRVNIKQIDSRIIITFIFQTSQEGQFNLFKPVDITYILMSTLEPTVTSCHVGVKPEQIQVKSSWKQLKAKMTLVPLILTLRYFWETGPWSSGHEFPQPYESILGLCCYTYYESCWVLISQLFPLLVKSIYFQDQLVEVFINVCVWTYLLLLIRSSVMR